MSQGDRRNWLPTDYVAHGWSWGVHARDARGMKVPPYWPAAVQWSIYGAIVAAQSGVLDPEQADRMVRLIEGKLLGGQDMMLWQDRPGRTQAEVVELLERAEAAVLGKR